MEVRAKATIRPEEEIQMSDSEIHRAPRNLTFGDRCILERHQFVLDVAGNERGK